MPNRTIQGHAMGWLPDYPDIRDYTLQHKAIQLMLKESKVVKAPAATPPSAVDLRQWCSPVEDQRELGSCTAQAGVGLVEYYERRAFGKHLDASRLFLYKVTRNLLHWTGDTGAFMRTTLKALVLFGVPPEEYWPYEVGRFEDEPPPFCYVFAQNYQAVRYLRLDPPGTKSEELLGRVKHSLANGYACAFGFTVYSSISEASQTGEIPFPEPGERVEGGHAVMAVGYDNAKKIDKQKGALLIRNSWGTGWGQKGYGWLPYAYVEAGIAEDFWTLLKQEWIDTRHFD